MSRAILLLRLCAHMTSYKETILCPRLSNDFPWNILIYDYGFTRSFYKVAIFEPFYKVLQPMCTRSWYRFLQNSPADLQALQTREYYKQTK
jgi:hypothetical protein